MLQWNGKDLTSEDVYFMSESFSRAARSAREMARMLLRWLVLALPIGLLCGGIGTAFHLAVEAVTELRGAHGWLLWLLPAAGLAIVALYKGTKCEGVGTNNVIRAVQSGEAVSPLLVPAIFFGTVHCRQRLRASRSQSCSPPVRRLRRPGGRGPADGRQHRLQYCKAVPFPGS